jgi:hypothetical protein
MNFERSPFCEPTFPESSGPEKDYDPMPKETSNSEAFDAFTQLKNPEPNAEYTCRITYLENCVIVLKKQVITTMDQAEKSSTLSKNVSLLEDQVSTLKSQIAQLEDGDKYMTEILERAGEQLNCKFLGAPEYFCAEGYVNMIFLMQVLV